jgi:cytidylate kinase
MRSKNLKVITIDGPASSGKSTVAQIVCKSLGFQHLNSGAIYRTLALLCFEEHSDYTDSEKIKK